MQAIDHLLLRGHIRLGLGHLRREPAGLEPRQHLPLPDVIALLHQHRGDALAAVEGQLHLAQIDVAVQTQFRALALAAHEPPQRRHDGDDDDCASENNSQSRHLGHAVTCLTRSLRAAPPPKSTSTSKLVNGAEGSCPT